ncbi:MAG: Ppx/GppA phosphatase family protein, partial [Xanthobacteraceae bacterium]
RELKVRVRAKGRTLASKRWLERQLNDPYVTRAKREGLRSRAAYKLIEIDDKYRLLKPGRRVVDRLIEMTYDERVANACIGAERADLVLAGCAILEAIRRAFPFPRLRVADRGLREGILVEMMRADGAWGRA